MTDDADDTRGRATSAVVGVVVVLCALLLTKWLAVGAVVAVLLVLVARAVRRVRPRATVPAPRAVPEHAVPPADDCTWCGLAGGHRDIRGRWVRPRIAHAPGAAGSATRASSAR